MREIKVSFVMLMNSFQKNGGGCWLPVSQPLMKGWNSELHLADLGKGERLQVESLSSGQ